LRQVRQLSVTHTHLKQANGDPDLNSDVGPSMLGLSVLHTLLAFPNFNFNEYGRGFLLNIP
jgi:hypothetical protein